MLATRYVEWAVSANLLDAIRRERRKPRRGYRQAEWFPAAIRESYRLKVKIRAKASSYCRIILVATTPKTSARGMLP